MYNPKDVCRMIIVVDFVEHPVVTNPNSPLAFKANKHLCPGMPWVPLQSVQGNQNPAENRFGHPLDVTLRRSLN